MPADTSACQNITLFIMTGSGGVSGCQWGTGTRETEVRLDGWCEGGVRQQSNDGGGCATMRESPESVESPGTYVTK